MTNPNKAIGTPAAYNGRGSVNGFGDSLGILDGRGIISGWNCQPKSGMTVQIGGQSAIRDIALAEDNANNRVTINNRSAAPIDVEIGAAPATNNRIDAIVAYVDQPANGDESTTDNPDACGIIVVSGTVAANPQAPTEAQIRTAITADGATGANAYYVILATVRVGTNVTTIGAGVITQGTRVKPTIPNLAITTAMLAANAVTSAKIAGNAVTSAKISLTKSTTTPGWTKVQLGTTINLYFARGTQQISQQGSSWQNYVPLQAPDGFQSAHEFYGFVSGVSADAAEIVTGTIGASGQVIVQVNNQYAGPVSNPVDWTAVLIEFL